MCNQSVQKALGFQTTQGFLCKCTYLQYKLCLYAIALQI